MRSISQAKAERTDGNDNVSARQQDAKIRRCTVLFGVRRSRFGEIHFYDPSFITDVRTLLLG